MTIGHDLEHRLDSWMQEDASLPDDLAEVIAKLPETPQRHRRWSSISDLTWRTRSMFSATRVAAFVAIFTLGATSAMYLVPRQAVDHVDVVPGAETPSPDDMARVTWHSTMSKADPASGTTTATEYGETFEDVIAEYEVTASDERLSGTASYVVNGSYLVPSDSRYPANVFVGSVTIEAANGTWEGSFVGLDYPGTPDNESQHILTGTGAYEGLTAVMTTRDDVTSGLIFPGELPDLP
jgi:hypothetical protein